MNHKQWSKRLAVTAAVCGALLSNSVPCPASAVDAFYSLLEKSTEVQGETKTNRSVLLDKVMSGYPDGETFPLLTAEDLDDLAAVTGRDLASAASKADIPMARLRNLYYKALSYVLRLTIDSDPQAAERFGDVYEILELFLFLEEDELAAQKKAEIRSRMNAETAEEIAAGSGLAAGYIDFLVMDENWNDADWNNDDDWIRQYPSLYQSGASPSGFEPVTIGGYDVHPNSVIREMQETLIRLGYLTGNADGIFGPRTQAALIEFQIANGSRPTGRYEYTDLLKLNSVDVVSRYDYDDDFWDEDDFEHIYGGQIPDWEDDDRYDDDDGHGDDNDRDDDDRYDDDDHDDDDHDDDDHDDDDHDDDDRYDNDDNGGYGGANTTDYGGYVEDYGGSNASDGYAGDRGYDDNDDDDDDRYDDDERDDDDDDD